MLILRVMVANYVNLCFTLFWSPQGYIDIEKSWCQFFNSFFIFIFHEYFKLMTIEKRYEILIFKLVLK